MSDLCKILYTEEYSATMAELRQALETQQYTEEALALTERALGLLASHYTTWHFRFELVKRLGKDLFAELDWCELVALENEKNYQIWNYRQRIVETILQDPELAPKLSHNREHPILNMMLQQDPKNHHVWLYRKWYVERFGLFQDVDELAFTTKLIAEDARNNSAWTHRFFLNFSGLAPAEEVALSEVRYTQDQINLCPQNPSPWNYLAGITTKMNWPVGKFRDFTEKYATPAPGSNEILSSFALELLAKIEAADGNIDAATNIYDQLASTYDPIRAKYWAYLASRLK